MLRSLAELASLGVHEPTREMVAAMAGYANIQSRPIREAFADGLQDGAIEAPAAGRVRLTVAGIAAAERPAAPITARDMRDRIALAIGSVAGRVIDELVAVYPNQLSRQDVATALGYANIQSRPIREAFSKLLDTGFAIAPQPGFLKASEALFP